MYCTKCGTQIPVASPYCIKCGSPTGSIMVPPVVSAKRRSTYILLGFFLGVFGANNFYAEEEHVGNIKLLGTFSSLFLLFMNHVNGTNYSVIDFLSSRYEISPEMMGIPIPIVSLLSLPYSALPLFFLWGWTLFDLCLVQKDGKGVPFK